jgi:hypothetical protein
LRWNDEKEEKNRAQIPSPFKKTVQAASNS